MSLSSALNLNEEFKGLLNISVPAVPIDSPQTSNGRYTTRSNTKNFNELKNIEQLINLNLVRFADASEIKKSRKLKIQTERIAGSDNKLKLKDLSLTDLNDSSKNERDTDLEMGYESA